MEPFTYIPRTYPASFITHHPRPSITSNHSSTPIILLSAILANTSHNLRDKELKQRLPRSATRLVASYPTVHTEAVQTPGSYLSSKAVHQHFPRHNQTPSCVPRSGPKESTQLGGRNCGACSPSPNHLGWNCNISISPLVLRWSFRHVHHSCQRPRKVDLAVRGLSIGLLHQTPRIVFAQHKMARTKVHSGSRLRHSNRIPAQRSTVPVKVATNALASQIAIWSVSARDGGKTGARAVKNLQSRRTKRTWRICAKRKLQKSLLSLRPLNLELRLFQRHSPSSETS